MQWSASLRVFLLLLMVGCESVYSAGTIKCKSPPFDRRRCYQVYTSNPHLNYSDASAACRATQQRLASLETEQLVMFVKDNVAFQVIWIGLSRTSDGQPDVWTSGRQLQASLYPSVTLSVNRGSQDVGKLCSLIINGSTVTFINTLCSGTADRLCETFRSNIFQVRPIGHVVNDVSEGQLVNSDIPISIFDCIRKCRENWTCEAIGHDGVTCLLHFQQVRQPGEVVKNVTKGQLVASAVAISVFDCARNCRLNWTCDEISHDGVTCQLHFQQAGHNINVTSSAKVFTRMKRIENVLN